MTQTFYAPGSLGSVWIYTGCGRITYTNGHDMIPCKNVRKEHHEATYVTSIVFISNIYGTITKYNIRFEKERKEYFSTTFNFQQPYRLWFRFCMQSCVRLIVEGDSLASDLKDSTLGLNTPSRIQCLCNIHSNRAIDVSVA